MLCCGVLRRAVLCGSTRIIEPSALVLGNVWLKCTHQPECTIVPQRVMPELLTASECLVANRSCVHSVCSIAWVWV